MLKRKAIYRIWLMVLLLSLPIQGANAAENSPNELKIVTSIRPLYGILSALIAGQGLGQAELLLDGTLSPHSFSLTPSMASKLQAANMVIWIGEGLERPLEKPLKTLASNAKIITLYPEVKADEHKDEHNHDAKHKDEHNHEAKHKDEHNHDHDHDHHGMDPHIWLNTDQAIMIADTITVSLIELNPAATTQYQANLALFKENIQKLNQSLDQKMAKLQVKDYYVFHDAYNGFETRYGLEPSGVFKINPEQALNASKIREIQDQIAQSTPACFFAEPQFPDHTLQDLAKNFKVKVVTIDPLGSNLPLDQQLYFSFMEDIANSFTTCFE